VLPSATLARVEAHRRIVDLHEGSHECAYAPGSTDWIDSATECTTVHLLALAYAHRPEWREEWRP
jgi:hypothetical protein